MSDSAQPACPFCRSATPARERFRKSGHGVFRCPECRSGFVFPRPAPGHLTAIYGDSYFQRGHKYGSDPGLAENPNRPNELCRVGWVRQRVASGRLLDVGCGIGSFLAEVRAAGFDVAGVELSAYAADRVRKGLQIPVLAPTLESLPAEGPRFDIITFWDVIEHVPDPEACIRRAHERLNPGGVILMTTGDFTAPVARVLGRSWPLLTPPEHLSFFSPLGLSSLMERCGFRVDSVRHPGKRVSWGLLALKAHENLGPWAAIPLRRFVSMFGLERKSCFLNLGDIMLLAATRRDGPSR
jgi:SAM-dependent methyltransferase